MPVEKCSFRLFFKDFFLERKEDLGIHPLPVHFTPLISINGQVVIIWRRRRSDRFAHLIIVPSSLFTPGGLTPHPVCLLNFTAFSNHSFIFTLLELNVTTRYERAGVKVVLRQNLL